MNMIEDISLTTRCPQCLFILMGNSVFFNDSFSQTLYNLSSGSMRVGV